MRASFAIPGDLSSPTGGYGYARRLLREASSLDLHLQPVALPGGFPTPTAAQLGQTEEILAALPPGEPVLIDGLAYGAFPKGLIAAIPGPVVALCHHPLALETGIEPALAAHLMRSERRALSMAAHVLTTSHATAAIVAKDYGVPGEQITVAPPGTDPAPRATGSQDKTCRLLSVGSITARKGHVRLIAALAQMPPGEWTLRIAGPMPDPVERAALQAAIAEAEFGDRVELTGPLSLPRLTAAYQASDLFVLASEYEGFGMAFVEAMSHGLPTVGLTSPAVEEATAGAACLVGTQDLSETLRLLISDRGTRQALADRCWTAAQTFMRWPQTSRIVADVIRKVAA